MVDEGAEWRVEMVSGGWKGVVDEKIFWSCSVVFQVDHSSSHVRLHKLLIFQIPA